MHVDEDLKAEVIAAYNSDLQKAVQVEEKLAREAATKAVKEAIISVYSAKYENDENLSIILRDLAEILEGMEHAEVRRLITEDKIRLMDVKLMKFVHWMRKLTLLHVVLHTELVYLLAVKLKPCQP